MVHQPKDRGFGPQLVNNTMKTAHQIVSMDGWSDLFMVMGLKKVFGVTESSDMTTNIIFDSLDRIFSERVNTTLRNPNKGIHF